MFMKKILPFIIIFIFSCEDDGITPNYGCINPEAINYQENANVDDGSCIFDTTISYHHDNLDQIFSSNCISCHSSSGGQIPYLDTYKLIKNCDCTTAFNPDESQLYIEINSNNMPQGSSPLADQDKEKIRRWISEGMPK